MEDDFVRTRFKNQYFQLLDPASLSWPPSSSLRRADFQNELWRTTFDPEALKYPPPERHQARVLKELVSRIEASIIDPEEDTILDELASHSALLNATIGTELAAAQQKSYVTYAFSSDGRSTEGLYSITLAENPSLIMVAGTTGARTWEAARHLGAYLCTPSAQGLVNGHGILELGAGTGLLSVLCARYLGARRVLATDGDGRMVENLKTNFFLNGVDGLPHVECDVLGWGRSLLALDREELTSGAYDVVLGADLTYDSKLFPALVATFGELLKYNPKAVILVSASVRNEDTMQDFVERCRSRSYRVEDIEYERPPLETATGPFYSDLNPIRIFRITGQQREAD